jgi:hypothetical protein
MGGFSKPALLARLSELVPQSDTEPGRSRTRPLPATGTLHNTAVNRILYEVKAVSLSPDQAVILTNGLRFIPRSSRVADANTVLAAINRFAHRVQVAIDWPIPGVAHVGHTRVPVRYPATNHLSAPKGELGAVVVKHRQLLLRKRAALHELVGTPPPSNLPARAYRTIRKFGERSDIVVRPADKNLGVTVMSKEWYVSAALAHLGDSTTYTRKGVCSAPRAEMIVRHHRDTLRNILRGAGMSVFLIDKLLGPLSAHRLARFYVIPKLHKQSERKPYEARPITSQSGAPTEVASVMLASLLNEALGYEHWWSLRDTTALIKHLEGELPPLPADDPTTGRTVWLISADVTALYPNMDTNLIEVVVREEVQSHLARTGCDQPTTEATLKLTSELLSFVLHNCVFTFDAGDGQGPVLYQQMSGAAMGSACIPPAANMYVAHLVKPTLDSWRARVGGAILVTAKGFIDDLFLVLYGTRDEAQELTDALGNVHPKFKLTSVISSDAVQYLDVEVYRTPGADKLSVRPYVKELNKFLYIPPWSGHAPHALTSFISGEVRRLIRNSSLESDAINSSIMLMANLLGRGYRIMEILREFSRVSYTDRQSMLYPPDPHAHTARVAALTVPYNPVNAMLPLGEFVHEVQSVLQRQGHENLRVTLGWTNERNLQSLLHLQWPKA